MWPGGLLRLRTKQLFSNNCTFSGRSITDFLWLQKLIFPRFVWVEGYSRPGWLITKDGFIRLHTLPCESHARTDSYWTLTYPWPAKHNFSPLEGGRAVPRLCGLKEWITINDPSYIIHNFNLKWTRTFGVTRTNLNYISDAVYNEKTSLSEHCLN